jgi:hypothetical protein
MLFVPRLLLLIGCAVVTSASSTGLTKSISRGHQAGIRASAGASTIVWGQLRSTRMPVAFAYLIHRLGPFEPAGEFTGRLAKPFRTYAGFR